MSRRSDREIAARVLLLAAFVCLIGFHVLPVDEVRSDGSVERGWGIWPALWRMINNFDWFVHILTLQPLYAMGLAAFAGWVLTSSLSPFCVQLLIRSRALWWASIITAGSSVIIGLILLTEVMGNTPSPFSEIPPAPLAMLASVLLNFLGLAVLARIKPLDPALPESPDNPLAP